MLFLSSIAVAIVVINAQRGGPYITELYETCTGEQGYQARCGPGANCFLIGGVPTCHCVMDMSSGLPLAGNPYRGCTADLTGKWEAYFTADSFGGAFRPLSDPFSNEPFIIQIDRTDAILKTQYMTGAIFIVTAITVGAAGVCARAYVDVNDNQSVIFELAEGFVDISGRNMFFRNRRGYDISLWKKFPKAPVPRDARNLWGGWKKYDGNKVKICEFKDKVRQRVTGRSTVITPTWAYWFNDESFGAPAMRLSTALWLDDTLPFEQAAFDTTNRFVQLGWFGELSIGAGTISIIAPGDGKQIFALRRIYDYNLPMSPGLPTQSFTLTGADQISALQKAATAALPAAARLLASNTTLKLPYDLYDKPRPRRPSDDFGIFTAADRLREMGAANITQHRRLKELQPYPNQKFVNLNKGGQSGTQSASQSSKKSEGASKQPLSDGLQFIDSFFGIEDELGEEVSTYNMFWTRMTSRLADASRSAEEKLKKVLRF